MLRLALSGLWRHKARVFFVSLAAIIGVAFSAAVLILGDSIRQGLSSVSDIGHSSEDLIIVTSACLLSFPRRLFHRRRRGGKTRLFARRTIKKRCS